MGLLSISVASTRNGVIGMKNDMPWHIPGELKQFRLRTTGHTIIMGRKTYDSIGKPLPKRRNIIISRSLDKAPDGTELFGDIDSALAAVKNDMEAFIIGGAEIFKQTFDRVDRIYLSRVEEEYEGDTFFPAFTDKEWNLTETTPFEGFTLETWNRK